MDRDTIRIFSFPGGGTKGYGSNRFMQKFLHQWGIAQADFWKYADVICGTSIGAILGSAYAYGKTPDEMEVFFLEKAKRIFTIRTLAEKLAGSHNAGTDSNRPNKLEKIALIANNEAFYSSPYPDSDYGHNILQQTLVDNFGSATLANLKTHVIIPAVEEDLSKHVLFSNFEDATFFKGKDETIVNVCRASSAADPYLPSHEFNGHRYIDGIFLINDVVEAAVNLGYTVKPNASRVVIVGAGTGIGNAGFDGSEPLSSSDIGFEKLFKKLNLTMTGAEEMTRINQEYRSTRLVDYHYYKFQPRFLPSFQNELDNSSSQWFADLANIVDAHYAAESDKISNIINRLTI